MRRVLAIAATLLLAAPTLALAENPGGAQGGRGHPPARAVVPHGGPRVGGPAGHGPVIRGPVVRGPVVRGPIVRGPVVRGPVVRGPVVGGPVVRGPVVRGPVRVGGPAGAPYVFHGRAINRVHFARPWVYPRGWGYRRWGIGAVLPALFLAPAYYYSGWEEIGLTPPPFGFQWVQYGPDLLLVNVTTGEVVDVAYGVFY